MSWLVEQLPVVVVVGEVDSERGIDCLPPLPDTQLAGQQGHLLDLRLEVKVVGLPPQLHTDAVKDLCHDGEHVGCRVVPQPLVLSQPVPTAEESAC